MHGTDITEFQRAASVAAAWQDAGGLWHNFWERDDSGLETSGSAGVAAALALGVKLGCLDHSYTERAERAWHALLDWITPDGLLTGVAQTNQGGEELQMSGYRTIFPMGMGLVAQLGTALGKMDGRWLQAYEEGGQ